MAQSVLPRCRGRCPAGAPMRRGGPGAGDLPRIVRAGAAPGPRHAGAVPGENP
jgi:hypothetical protein